MCTQLRHFWDWIRCENTNKKINRFWQKQNQNEFSISSLRKWYIERLQHFIAHVIATFCLPLHLNFFSSKNNNNEKSICNTHVSFCSKITNPNFRFLSFSFVRPPMIIKLDFRLRMDSEKWFYGPLPPIVSFYFVAFPSHISFYNHK